MVNVHKLKIFPINLKIMLKVANPRADPKRSLIIEGLKAFVAIGPIHAPKRMPINIMNAIKKFIFPFRA